MNYPDLTSAEVIADSTWDGVRLTTMRVTLPRFLLAEFNTHRVFSRNSASSRAIPLKKQIALVKESPFYPQRWPRNGKGMKADGYFDDEPDGMVRAWTTGWSMNAWRKALDSAIHSAEQLGSIGDVGVHKQIASRLLEPFMWHTVIVSSTEWENFFAQRDHEDAQPEMQTLARAMRAALEGSTPVSNTWHIPFACEGPANLEKHMITAVARCARVSYGRELEEKTYEEDAALVERLIRAGHWSPFEHVGIVGDPRLITHLGNFAAPWSQLRHHWSQYLPSIAAKCES